jgi:hypothetical protein
VHQNLKKQCPVSFQLLVFLFCISKQGSCGSSLAVSSHFGIGKGSVNIYIDRCISALHGIHIDVVYWPDQNEREEIRENFPPQDSSIVLESSMEH